MTRYFEVHDTDALARRGELRLSNSRYTPCIADDLLSDAGSLWSDERELPSGDESCVTVLPHRAMPQGTPRDVVQEKTPSYPETDYPSAAVISAEKPRPHGQDMYILTGVDTDNARKLVREVLNARQKLEPDTALMIAGVVTPSNVALLSYLGVDCFDSSHAEINGKAGVYMTLTDEVELDELSELPCRCNACNDNEPGDLGARDISRHNRNLLEMELAETRRKIRGSSFREYIEGRARAKPMYVEVLRLLDQSHYDYLFERTAVARTEDLIVNSSESHSRPEIKRFQSRINQRYTAPRNDVAVFLPCSARKPYSESKSHGEFTDRIRGRAHEVILTSPMGVVPRELEATYPAGHYDIPVTGRWSMDELDTLSTVLSRYLDRNRYDRIVAHLPQEGYHELFKMGTEELDEDIDVSFTVKEHEHPTDTDALSRLDEQLDGEMQANYDIKDKWVMRAVADYQFGEHSFDDEFDLKYVSTQGRFPRLRLLSGDEIIATLSPEYGFLALTTRGANVFEPPLVEIDDFEPSGSILAPGVVDADKSIRIGDEVMFRGPSAHGVGRAYMTGSEMTKSTRGVAVDVRHSEAT